MFANDSVPAGFSITRNELIVHSSNAFAILGLRSLYIVLERYLATMHYLHYGLAAVSGEVTVRSWDKRVLTTHPIQG